MGSCFSSEGVPIRDDPMIAVMDLDRRRESTFSAAYYGYGPRPYGNRVVRNNQDSDYDCYLTATTTSITLLKQVHENSAQKTSLFGLFSLCNIDHQLYIYIDIYNEII